MATLRRRVHTALTLLALWLLMSITSTPFCNCLYHSENIESLPNFTDKDRHFLWSDIQFSKGSTNKDRLIEVTLGEGKQQVIYRVAPCRGVKKCASCDHTVPNSAVTNNYKKHPVKTHTNLKLSS